MKLFGSKEPKEVKVITEEEKAERREKAKEIGVKVLKGVGLFAAGAVAVICALAAYGNVSSHSDESTDSVSESDGAAEASSESSTEE